VRDASLRLAEFGVDLVAALRLSEALPSLQNGGTRLAAGGNRHVAAAVGSLPHRSRARLGDLQRGAFATALLLLMARVRGHRLDGGGVRRREFGHAACEILEMLT